MLLMALWAAQLTKEVFNLECLMKAEGAAVRGPRAQADRTPYTKKAIFEIVKNYKNLEIIEGSVEDLITKNGQVTRVELSSGEKIECIQLF